MSAYPPEAVEAAANRLMSALALHEDSRGTATDILADLWDTARADAIEAVHMSGLGDNWVMHALCGASDGRSDPDAQLVTCTACLEKWNPADLRTASPARGAR
jgi:hypothetical protein